MFERIVMVCVGNICRSPMAEALLAARLRKAASSTVVESAGVAALVGSPADPAAERLMREAGLDIATHRARQVTQDLVQRASLVLTMDADQTRWIEGRWPEARGRVHLLGRWGSFEIPDPYGGTEDDFRNALALIERGIDEWSSRLGAAPRLEPR